MFPSWRDLAKRDKHSLRQSDQDAATANWFEFEFLDFYLTSMQRLGWVLEGLGKSIKKRDQHSLLWLCGKILPLSTIHFMFFFLFIFKFKFYPFISLCWRPIATLISRIINCKIYFRNHQKNFVLFALHKKSIFH